MDGAEDEGRVLLDPNALSADGTVAVAAFGVTDDGTLLAYATSGAGSDWMTWHVRDVDDRPRTIRTSSSGRSSPRRPGCRTAPASSTAPSTPAAPGAEYLESERSRCRSSSTGSVTRRAKTRSSSTLPRSPSGYPRQVERRRPVPRDLDLAGNRPRGPLRVLDLEDPGTACACSWPTSHRASYVANVGSTFYLAHRRRGRAPAARRRRPRAARDASTGARSIPESSTPAPRGPPLRRPARLPLPAGRLLAAARSSSSTARTCATSRAGVSPRSCDDRRARRARGPPDSDLVHFDVTSSPTRARLWSHDLASGETRLRPATGRTVRPQALRDRAGLRHVRRRRRGSRSSSPAGATVANGDVPVLLYGYGGFDIAMTPAVPSAWAVFVERGGLFAMAILRGGGEYGRSWHDAGRLATSRESSTTSAPARAGSPLGMVAAGPHRDQRGSNGGLLVGACITQHPELFGAAVAEVGVFDMLRFHVSRSGGPGRATSATPTTPSSTAGCALLAAAQRPCRPPLPADPAH